MDHLEEEDCKADGCVKSICEEGGGNSEAINFELSHDASRTLIQDDEDKIRTVAEPICDDAFFSFGYETRIGNGDIGDRNSERTAGGDFDTRRGLWIGGECEDTRELSDDLSDVGSYTTAEGSDMGMEVKMETNVQEAEMESLYEPCSDQEIPMVIDSNTDDEIDVCSTFVSHV
jgi:hypothetical protein